jgi:hypothetical protein
MAIRMLRTVTCIGLLCLAACSTPTVGGLDIALGDLGDRPVPLDAPIGDISVDDGGASDVDAGPQGDVADLADGAGADGSSPARSPCPQVVDGGCQPIGATEIVTLSQDAAIEFPGISFFWPDGTTRAIYPRYDTGQLFSAGSTDLVTFTAAERLPVALASDTTGVTLGEDRILFFYGRLGPAGALALQRALVPATGDPSTPSAVTITGADGVEPYWPQTVALPDGRILLGFVEAARDANRRSYLGTSSDGGLSFAMRPAPFGAQARPGILIHVGLTASGAWVLTWQESDASFRYFTSYVQLSADQGQSWTDPIRIVPDNDNVHDAFPVTRQDSGADLYYLPETGDLNVFRRRLDDDGTLGPEQRVTTAELGHIEKPQPRRLPDGRLGMLASRRMGANDYRVFFTVLEGDAPP